MSYFKTPSQLSNVKFERKEYSVKQKEIISQINEKLKNECFKPKDETNFINFEIKAYLDLLSEFLSLPREIQEINEVKFEVLSLRIIQSLKTKNFAKKIITVSKILSHSNSLFLFKNGDKKGYIKLISIKKIISNKLYLIDKNKTNRIGYYYWGEKISSEIDLNKIKPIPVKKKTPPTYKKLDSDIIVKSNSLARANPKLLGGKWAISIRRSLLLDLEQRLQSGKKEITVSELLNHFTISVRTLYKWNQIDPFGIISSKVNISGFINFVKNQNEKFIIIEDVNEY
jgi:hypothetical protein